MGSLEARLVDQDKNCMNVEDFSMGWGICIIAIEVLIEYLFRTILSLLIFCSFNTLSCVKLFFVTKSSNVLIVC